MTTRFYAVTHDDRTIEDPYVVFRYRTDDDGAALGIESWVPETSTWAPDVDGWFGRYIFNGELGAEEITEAQADAAIAARAAPT